MEEAGRVYDRFDAEVGHTMCGEIHKKWFGKVYHLIIPEERTAFHEEGGHSRAGCPKVCGIAARIAAEALLDIKEREFRATRQHS